MTPGPLEIVGFPYNVRCGGGVIVLASSSILLPGVERRSEASTDHDVDKRDAGSTALRSAASSVM